jgi:hypothetical protein
MTTSIVGGIRSRLIFDSLYNTINNGLTALGWFESGRRYAPVTFLAEEQETSTEIPLNTLALSDENVSSMDIELGSVLADMTRYYYVDFFAESDVLGKQLIGDVRDLLEGRMPDLGPPGPVINVYDYRQATPPIVFACQVLNVRVDRAHSWTQPWLRHWYSCQLTLIDTYGTDEDAYADVVFPMGV